MVDLQTDDRRRLKESHLLYVRSGMYRTGPVDYCRLAIWEAGLKQAVRRRISDAVFPGKNEGTSNVDVRPPVQYFGDTAPALKVA